MATVWTPGRRFRIAGTNWEGRHWSLARGAVTLATQIEAAYPGNHPLDGTVASEGHDAGSPNSDHRPKPLTGPGTVRAIDTGELIEDQGIELAEALRTARDPRTRYVIHEGRIFSSYDHSNGPAWTWRPYGGPNAHLGHVHTSVWPSADTDPAPWALTIGGMMLTPAQQDDLAEFLDRLDAINSSVAFVTYLVPWFRLNSGLSPAQLAELEESDEIEELEARLEELAGTIGTTTEAVIAEVVRRLTAPDR